MKITSPSQKGSILVAVLWCVALLSVLVIGMLYTTRIDLTIAKSYNDRIQARYLALAGIEKAKALLYQDAKNRQGDGNNYSGDLYDSAENFKDCTLGRGSYRVFRRAVDENSTAKIVYGISDEESRLNINTATADELTKITGLKSQVAASILEWRKSSGVTSNNSDNSENQGNEPPSGPPPSNDNPPSSPPPGNDNPPSGPPPGNDNSDSTNSVSGGAGTDYYASLNPPRQPRYGPFQTSRELLMVRGVSRKLFFGDDFKQNELLDFASDEDATNSSPSDVAEGATDDQQPVQNVQSANTEQTTDTQTTTFIVKKSSKWSRSDRSNSTSSDRNEDNPTDAGWNALITVDSQESNLNASGSARVNIQTASEADLAAVQGFNEEIARAIVQYRAKKKFKSIADLLDVTPSQTQGEFGKTITSPVNTGESVINQDLLQQVADDLTVNSETQFRGLININTAKAEVLNCLTGLTPELTQAIISYRQSTGNFQNIAYLLQVPGITREIFQQVAPRITTRSETFRIIAEGKVRSSGIRQRIQAIVLVTPDNVKTLSYREDL